MKRICYLASITAMLLPTASAHAISFQTLGHLPGTNGAGASAVSANGKVVVGGSGNRAFRWTETTGMMDLGIYGSASGVSADGSVIVGTLYRGGIFDPRYARAFRWTEETGAVDLGAQPGCFQCTSAAWGVSGDGSIVVGRAEGMNFRWTQATGMTSPITSSPNGFFDFNWAAGTSFEGSVVFGGYEHYGPFRWSAADGLELLSVPPELGTCQAGVGCAATAITPDGSIIVGGPYYVPSPSDPNGFRIDAARWTQSGIDLIRFNPSGLGAVPRAISADGRVIVGDDGSGGEAVYWSEATGPQFIRDMLTNSGIDVSDWYTFGSANGVSADGLTVVGAGFRPSDMGGTGEAWIMHIPEPSSMVLILSSLGVIYAVRRRTTRTVPRVLFCSIASLSIIHSTAQLQAATFQGLGFLPTDGPIGSSAYAVSADGAFVVGTSNGLAFRWSQATGMTGLGFGGAATAVSADGSVVVGGTNSSMFGDAIRWTQATGAVDIGQLGFVTNGSLATGVSADGSVVVGSSAHNQDEAFRWTAATGMQGLGFLGTSSGGSRGYGTSADGSVVVGWGNGTAFRWTEQGGMAPLSTAPEWQSGAVAYAVTPNGEVVVGGTYGFGSALCGEDYCSVAFRWSAATGLVEIGELGAAIATSADGSVIVGYDPTNQLPDGPMLWTEAQGARLLHNVLVNDYGLDLHDWRLEGATGISADGRTIVGFGLHYSTGAREAWIAHIPEPSSVMLAFSGLGLIYASRRRTARRETSFAFVLSLVCALYSAANSYAVTIPTVPVGDVGNPDDPTIGSHYGGVSYAYNIGKYEVTVGQYAAFLNAVAATDTYNLYNPSMAADLNVAGIERAGGSGSFTYNVIGSADHPIAYVSWGDAARFTNWLNNGQPTGAEGPGTTETGAYTLNGATSNSALMAVTRNVGATWFIPTENEWYKAAYYQPTAAGGDSDGYWAYPMKTNSVPYSATAPGATAPDPTRVGNFYSNDMIENGYDDGYAVTGSGGYDSGQNYLTDVGTYASSPSYYGTFDQGGNVAEWNETAHSPTTRGDRGGAWNFDYSYLVTPNFSISTLPANEFSWLGFRVASAVPEPSSVVLTLAGIGLICASRRRAP